MQFKNLNKHKLFTAAHQMAHTLVTQSHNYRIAFSYALKFIWHKLHCHAHWLNHWLTWKIKRALKTILQPAATMPNMHPSSLAN